MAKIVESDESIMGSLKTGDILLNFCNIGCNWDTILQSAFRNKFFKAYIADKGTHRGSTDKLGMLTWAKESAGFYVYNLYCFIENKRDGDALRESALIGSLKAAEALHQGRRVIVPWREYCAKTEDRGVLEAAICDIFPDDTEVLFIEF
ncbi:hypothetical protein [Vibrio phage vB_VmeM-Yong XC32]|nr:hypothetical protein [Vibrio phage vB_VmeM-Yong XC31]QAX96414.1 hypothetical protein [Vibrio phage vB_VmeM-Yong XC32]QAX96731.1 hypothetical protein [Vibrio phage vB_VmeM-Yong MS31]QAX97050.1 hypothetical protein [Vibrio phage vB_VmeM-Yong MS32]